MVSIQKAFAAASLLVSAALTTDALAQQASKYPDKPVRFIVAASAGGPSDVMARMVAEKLTQKIKQPVLVENRPGGGMLIGTTEVAKAEPDGYTLLFTTSTPIVMTPFTRNDVSYNVRRDFTTVAHIGTTPLVLYVNGATEIRSLDDLAAQAKARPDTVAYGSYGVGSSAHVLGEYFSRQAGITMVHVPYKGVAPSLQELAGGQIVAAVADIGTAAGLVEAGKIRPIAVTGSQRSSALPDVPTFAEQGIDGMEPFSPWWGLFAPAKTPPAIVKLLSDHVQDIVQDPEFQPRMRALGIDPTGASTEKANEMTNDELDRWQKIIAGLSDIKFE